MKRHRARFRSISSLQVSSGICGVRSCAGLDGGGTSQTWGADPLPTNEREGRPSRQREWHCKDTNNVVQFFGMVRTSARMLHVMPSDGTVENEAAVVGCAPRFAPCPVGHERAEPMKGSKQRSNCITTMPHN